MICTACSKTLSRENVIGLCRACTCRRNHADPAVNAKRRAKQAEAVRTPESRAALSKRVSAHHRAWCPPGMWDEYQFLMRGKGLRSAIAKRIILEMAAPKPCTLTPFERAMERVKAGAGIREVHPLRRPDPNYSLTGVSDVYAS